jgi:nucleotidyltransferase/DNA polymerase involved in DNA repair
VEWCVYVDMDAFYVACELKDRPELIGQPVVVGPDPKGGAARGVVLSASYEARAFGLRSALPVARAYALCPTARWIPPDFEKYEKSSVAVRDLLRRYSDRVVPYSIDEAALFVDLSDTNAVHGLAEQVQASIRTELALPCSVGAAPFRTVAKMASDRGKPGGIRIVPPERVVEFLAPLSVRTIPGVGPKTEAVLASLGVHTIGDLRRERLSKLHARLGVFAEELRALAEGVPHDRGFEATTAPKSRSSDMTFDEDTRDSDRLLGAIHSLAAATAAAMAKDGLRYRSVTVRVRWEDFTQIQHGHALPVALEGPEGLEREARRLAEEVFREERSGRNRRVRLLSVQAGQLVAGGGRQERLDQFESPAPEARPYPSRGVRDRR